MHHKVRHSSRGFALASAMLIVLLLAGISAGTLYLVNTESRLVITDLEGTQAFYGAEAGMEKMMADLSLLYSAILAPTVSDIQGLGATGFQPVIANITYPEYGFEIPNVSGEPIVETRTITSGPNEGLLAYITPLTLTVTALAPIASEVKMQREIELALIPVFQFGLFSETDLSYFPGPGFDFAGRVHTNGNLFLATSSASGLVFHNKLTAVGDIIRAELANGLGTVATGRTLPILIPTAPAGCDDTQPACRDLDEDEGSKVGGPASADTAGWTTTSLTTYNGFILNGDTGAKAMDLPFVSPGLRAIEMIRRPQATEDPNSLVGKSRLYNMAQIRVLISDTAAENPGGAGVRLANVPPYYPGGVNNYGATNTAFAEGRVSWDADFIEPPGVTAGDSWPLIDGYLLVQAKQADGTFTDVTMEWLNLGIARENADAILKFEQLKDNDGFATPDGDDLDKPDEVLHLGLYDSREGEVRDVSLGDGTDCAIGGIMNIVELDVGNLKRWFEGTTGTTGTNVDSIPQNGYVFYFSDRRGMLPDPNLSPPRIVGEYGFEDIINPATPTAIPTFPDGNLAL
ncbi:MAG: pilus assembly PilX N-terminal domain-containing protein, partial [Acidobacteria bacterium]|nr:pilus assembly PilX N-terminal domain-containing protein [Acidobacteriota bacterium]